MHDGRESIINFDCFFMFTDEQNEQLHNMFDQERYQMLHNWLSNPQNNFEIHIFLVFFK